MRDDSQNRSRVAGAIVAWTPASRPQTTSQRSDRSGGPPISRERGISEAPFYTWKAKFGGMRVSEVKQLRDLEEENCRLKMVYADQLNREMATLAG